MWVMIVLRSVSRKLPAATARPSRSTVYVWAICRDFLQEMTDVDDRQPALTEPFDDLEQPLGIAFGQRAGRLVEDDHPRVRDESPGHLDQLLGAHAQVAHLRFGPDIRMFQKREGFGDQPSVFAGLDQSGLDALLAEHDVGFDGEVRRQRQLLIDHRHAACPGIARPAGA